MERRQGWLERISRTTLAVALLLSACGGGPTSTIPGPVRDPVLSVTPPSGGHAGESAIFATSIALGQAPFSLDCTFGGGADPDLINDLEISREDGVAVVLADVSEETSFNYTFYLTSAYGATDSFSGSYTVLPAAVPKQAPVFVSAVLSEDLASLTVLATDADSPTLDIRVAPPEGVTVAPLSQTVASGNAAQFSISYAVDPPAEGFGALTVTASDPDGLSASLEVVIPDEPGAGPDYAPNALYAVPQAISAVVGEPLVIVVRTGILPNPFQYLNGVRVTVDSGASFVANSFNVGAAGGAAYDPDGLWVAMSPVDFIEPPVSVGPAPVEIGGGRIAFDFGLAPAVGNNLESAAGELFNFALRFDAPGIYVLGFQADDGVARTYYGWEDGGGVTTTGWGDLANSVAGVANSVVVTAE